MNATHKLPNNTGRALVLATVLVLFTAAFGAVFIGSAAAGGHDVDVSFNDTEGDVGDQVAVSFDIDPANAPNAQVGAYDVEINYDETVLSFVEMNGVDLDDPVANEPSPGTITANVGQATGDPVPLTAANVVFEIDPGVPDGTVATISLNDSASEFTDPIDPVTFESQDGNVTVGATDSNFQLSNLVPEEATVTNGSDPITVSADVTNTGTDPDEQSVELTVSDQTGAVVFSDTQTVQVDAGATETASFPGVPAGALDLGDYTHAIATNDDSISGSLTVQEQPDFIVEPDGDIAVGGPNENGLTIGDTYPLNQRDLFETPGSIYGLSGLPLPDDATDRDTRYLPIADGSHVGLVGLPLVGAEDDTYDWLETGINGTYPINPRRGTLLNYQQDAPTQTVSVSIEDQFEGDNITLDYTEMLDDGLQFDPAGITVVDTQNTSSGDVDTNLALQTAGGAGISGADVMITLDTSGSMGGNKLDQAKEGAKRFVELLGDDTNVGLAEFNNGASIVSPLGTSKSAVQTAIDNLAAGGSTNMSGGINVSQAELETNGTSSEQFMIVLGDGAPNVPGPGATRASAADARNVTDLNALGDGTTIVSLAYGGGADEALMEDIASPPKNDNGQVDAADTNAFRGDQDDIQQVFSDVGGLFTAQSGQLNITVNNINGDSALVKFEFVLEAINPTEGLSVDEPNAIDYETDHRLIFPDGDEERDNFVVFEAGATGISPQDADDTAFLGEPTQSTPIQSQIEQDDPGNSAANGTANPGSFLVWQNQRVTFDAINNGDTVDIFNIGTTTVERSGSEVEVYELGSKVPDSQVGFSDTAPGQVANLNTSNLTAGQQYFVTFGPDQSTAAVLDVRPLNLDASTTDTVANDEQGDPLEIQVGSDDTTGGDVEAWVSFEGNNVSDVVHVERGTLTGSGDRTLEVIPDIDLVGPGNYTVTVLHTESGVTTTAEFEILPPAPGPVIEEADDVEINSPDLLDPAESGEFDRGDIVPIDLTLEGGNVATVTFGSENEPDQNLEIHATVYDPTWNPGSGPTDITVYLNTYQIGEGMVEDGSGGFTQNRPTGWTPSTPTDAGHGFFTSPDDPTSALLPASSNPARPVNAFAGDQIDIYGGSQGGAVLSAGEQTDDGEFPGLRYDLHAAGDFSPHVAPGVDRDDVNQLDIEQRSTDGFRYWKALSEGENALNVSAINTVSDIYDAAAAGIVTPLDVEDGDFADHIAQNEFLIVQANTTGIEGVLKEAADRAGMDISEFVTFNGPNDDDVSLEFQNATTRTLNRYSGSVGPNTLLQYAFNIIENESAFNDRIGDAGPNEELRLPSRINPALSRLGAFARDESGDTNLDEFYIPYQLDPSSPSTSGLPAATGPITISGAPGDNIVFDSSTLFEPTGGEQDNVADNPVPRRVNPALAANSLGEGAANGTNPVSTPTDRLDYVTQLLAFDDVHLGPAGLEVPPVQNYTLTGTSTLAPGATLSLELITDVGENTQFFKELPAEAEEDEIVLTEGGPGGLTQFSATVDFNLSRNTTVENLPNTAFSTDVTLNGSSSGLVDIDGQPGVVLAQPTVTEFTLNDQRSDGDVVQVAAFEANRNATITIEDADGNVLGSTGVLGRGLQEQFNVVLDEPITENQEVTAVAEIVKPEVGEVLAEETAAINVEDEGAPFFQVSDLAPTAATVTVGDDVDVSATVENTGDTEGTQAVSLSVSGLGELASQDVTLGPGESQTVDFAPVSTEGVDPGDYEHTVASANTTQSGSLVIESEPEPPAPANFQIVTVTPEEATATQGDTVTVTATVQNTGEQEATQTVTLDIDGISFDADLTLGGSEADSVSFDVDTSDVDPGDYTHTVSTENDSFEGSLTIEEMQPQDDNASDNASEDGNGDGSGPGFGVAIAALALLGAALLAMRRRVEE